MKFKFGKRAAPQIKAKRSFNPLVHLKLWQKFVLIGLFGLVAAAVPTYNMLSELNDEVASATLEAEGVIPAQKLTRLVYLTQKHRGLASAYVAGDETVLNERIDIEKQIALSIAAIDPLLSRATDKKLSDTWAKIKTDWLTARNSVADRSINASGTFNQHTDLVALELSALNRVADYWKLARDPEEATYYLIQGSLVQLPALTEAMAQVRDFGTGRFAESERQRNAGQADKAAPARDAASLTAEADAANQGLPAADRTLVNNLLHDFDAIERKSLQAFEKAMDNDAQIKQALNAELRNNRASAGTLIEMTNYELLERENLDFDSHEFFNAFTQIIDRQFALTDVAIATLHNKLDVRVAALQRKKAILLGAVALALLLATLIAALITRNITGTLRGLQSAVEKVREGDFAALSAIVSRDEIGDLGRMVNSLLEERIAAQRKAEQDNEALNNSIIELLQVVYQMGQRDLTAKARVDESVIGTVASSVNQLVDETGKVLGQVTHIAKRVETASKQVKNQANNVMEVTRQEILSVTQMTKSIAEVISQMHQVAKLAENTNRAASDATESTDTALDRVSGTIDGMNTIREAIAESEKRIKRLGERSQEISGIVGLINTIAERTHVLSLNAAMQAAIAGEAGRGFAVVAEEVQRLAESSRNATSQIATLIQNIQIETNETIATVNRTISQVVAGSELAQKAGEQMRQTQKITAELAEMVRNIASGTASQTRSAAELRAGLDRIGTNTERTSKEVEAQTVQTTALAEAAHQLASVVSVFKLPTPELEMTQSLAMAAA